MGETHVDLKFNIGNVDMGLRKGKFFLNIGGIQLFGQMDEFEIEEYDLLWEKKCNDQTIYRSIYSSFDLSS